MVEDKDARRVNTVVSSNLVQMKKNLKFELDGALIFKRELDSNRYSKSRRD